VFNSGMDSHGCCGEDASLFASKYMPAALAAFALGGAGFVIQVRIHRAWPPLLELLLMAGQTLWFGFAAAVLMQSRDASALVIVPAMLNVLWATWWRADLLQRSLRAPANAPVPRLWKLLGAAGALGFFARLMLMLSGGTLLLGLLSGVLYLFGQAPDGFARVFTETYTHPFSKLVYDCSTETCQNGMYLCTIGDRGHAWVVGPTRVGWRQGKPIRCSRQLLVSNAFEASLARRLPWLQRWGRKGYDKLGTWFDPNRALFQSPWLCDLVHLWMLPAEGLFLLWLYLVEPKPEQLIAEQYLPHKA
jgi:hypothetical protein